MNPRPRVLCLAPYPVEGPSARYRVLQYLPNLREAGFDCIYRPFMESDFYRGFYRPGGALRKALGLGGSLLRRLGDARRARGYDVVFIHREAALFGPPLIERFIAHTLRKPVVFDFDDAIHLPNASPTHGWAAGTLKCPQKTPEIVHLSRAVIAGNRHLQEYAVNLNPNVTMIPTVVDADAVRPRADPTGAGQPIVLGWMGTHTTFPYLEALFPTLQEVAKRHSFVLRIVGAGREQVSLPGVEVDNRVWSLDREVTDLQSFDIGLYPMPHDAWALGKSGFKAVQYMAVGIPPVCAPVGATCDLIDDGVQGYLPASPVEWAQRLCHLIEDAALRARLGQAGRARIEDWYCLRRQAPRLKAVLEQAAG